MSRHDEKVFDALLRIPAGQFTTYKELAKAIGSSPRAVGQALKRNPRPVQVPCHRVVCSDFTLGGYWGLLNDDRKRALLLDEGIIIDGNRIINTEKMFYFYHLHYVHAYTHIKAP